MDERVAMRKPSRLTEGCGDTRLRLIQSTERDQRNREIAHYIEAKIVDGKARIERSIGRIEAFEAALQMGSCGAEVAERKSRNTNEAPAHQYQRRLVLGFAKTQHLLRQFPGLLQLCPHELMQELTVKHGHELRRSIKTKAESASAGIGLANGQSRITLCCHHRARKRELQVQLE